MTSLYASKYRPQTSCTCDHSHFANEPPERENPTRLSGGYDNVTYKGEFPPPEPPMGQYNDWELQFCKWWGWTWVKKRDQNSDPAPNRKVTTVSYSVPPEPLPTTPSTQNEQPQQVYNYEGRPKPRRSHQRQRRSFLDCFKRKPQSNTRQYHHRPQRATPVQTDMNTLQVVPVQQYPPTNNHQDNFYSSSDDFCCCCCCNMPPMPCCCCSCNNNAPQSRRNSKTIETQTLKNVREQETKMSEHHLKNKEKAQNTSKHCLQRRQKNCCRLRCCRPCVPCCRPMCCCACKNNNNNENNIDSPVNNVDKTVNFCNISSKFQQEALRNKYDFSGYKSKEFSVLHKPLDLLLKNNINIVKLFQDKEFVKIDDKPKTFLDATETISFLSTKSDTNKPDKEHCKLLTAVCDAILSSHKFESDSNPIFEHILKVTNSKSSITRSTTISSESINIEKILQGRSNSYCHNKRKDDSHPNSNNNIKQEIGIQAGDRVEKVESFSQTKKIEAMKLTRIPTPLLKRKVPVRMSLFRDDLNNRGAKRNGNAFNDIIIDSEHKKIKIDDEIPTSSEINPKLEDIERILNCINFDIGSSNNLENAPIFGECAKNNTDNDKTPTTSNSK